MNRMIFLHELIYGVIKSQRNHAVKSRLPARSLATSYLEVSAMASRTATRELGEDTLARRYRVLGEDHPDTSSRPAGGEGTGALVGGSRLRSTTSPRRQAGTPP